MRYRSATVFDDATSEKAILVINTLVDWTVIELSSFLSIFFPPSFSGMSGLEEQSKRKDFRVEKQFD